ncbi:MAG: hypothetical protein K9L59_04490 [Desulfobacterales bacterium]|nr:hypothetical protein [Desulfobacterales bacterium]
MSPEQIYEQLTELAEKLGITVSEKNLRQVGIRVQSGLCKVHGESVFIMDKHASIAEKVRLMAECLAQHPIEEVYLVPALREVIESHRPAAVSPTPDHSETGEASEKILH